MMTVRFPNGQAVQYNTANFASRFADGYTDLYTEKDGKWIAQVPNSCIIECVPACRVYNGITKLEDAQVSQLSKEIRSIGRKISKKPKS